MRFQEFSFKDQKALQTEKDPDDVRFQMIPSGPKEGEGGGIITTS